MMRHLLLLQLCLAMYGLVCEISAHYTLLSGFPVVSNVQLCHDGARSFAQCLNQNRTLHGCNICPLAVSCCAVQAHPAHPHQQLLPCW